MKTNYLSVLFCAAVLILTTTSCATLFTKKTQEVNFKGIPGTTIIDKDKNRVVTEIGTNGFGVGKFSKQLKKKNIEARKQGYIPRSYEMGTKIQGWFWGNLFLGGIVGMGIDAATGKMMKFSDRIIDVTLTPGVADDRQDQAISTEGKGLWDHTTNSKVKDSVIRWYIDSDPRGARIFWRVISNVPNEVPNTNESYMTTTPFEETRGFAIPGLTYQNSQNVTIEIKITKRGFEDQVKRYNVRQALDQQEISGFFELVEK